MSSLRRLAAVCALLALAFTCISSAAAQSFKKEILLAELNRPTGIELDVYGNLYYSEVPTPGVGGEESANRVVRYRLRSKRSFIVSAGEPEPVNIAADLFGRVYWTCKTAGVIIRSHNFGKGRKRIILDGLDQPVGLDSVGLSGGLLFTEIPTPGVNGDNGGDNSVNFAFPFFRRYFQFPISEGEPEPADVAINRWGTVYWTCTTAGVILSRGPDGQVQLVLSGLNRPVGLAVDFAGRIYYTEVPTPGVPGSDGGENRVSVYDPRTQSSTVISEGEPEPIDVTVSLNGRKVYWTCRTAGVIIKATRK